MTDGIRKSKINHRATYDDRHQRDFLDLGMNRPTRHVSIPLTCQKQDQDLSHLKNSPISTDTEITCKHGKLFIYSVIYRSFHHNHPNPPH